MHLWLINCKNHPNTLLLAHIHTSLVLPPRVQPISPPLESGRPYDLLWPTEWSRSDGANSKPTPLVYFYSPSCLKTLPLPWTSWATCWSIRNYVENWVVTAEIFLNQSVSIWLTSWLQTHQKPNWDQPNWPSQLRDLWEITAIFFKSVSLDLLCYAHYCGNR